MIIHRSNKNSCICCPECKRVLKPDQAEETNAPSTVLIKLLERLSSASKDCLASSDMAQVAHQIAHEYEELTKESGR